MSGGKIKFSLNIDKIKSIPLDKYEKNFTFIVNGKPYPTNRFIADLLSPIINNYHYEDETISSFTINTTTNTSKKEDLFERFLEIIYNDEIEVKEEEKKEINEYFIQLGNIDDYLRNNPISFTNVTADEIVDSLQFIETNSHYEIKDKENIINLKRMIDYVSEHFNEISSEKIQQIDNNLLQEIIKNNNLKLEDEDSLLRIVLTKYKNDYSSSFLFEYVRFNEISKTLMNEFVENFDICHLNTATFKNICKSVYSIDKSVRNDERYKMKYQEFQHNGNNEANGIFKYLTKETGGNIHANGTIEITTNSISSGDIKNLVDYENNNYFQFNNIQDSEICFDLKDNKIQITNYSIKSHSDYQGGDHLKSWILEVSKDKKDWTKIDEHENDSQLNGRYVIATFNTKKTNDFYRFIRLRQTGQNWLNRYYTEFNFIEFYGKLIKQ